MSLLGSLGTLADKVGARRLVVRGANALLAPKRTGQSFSLDSQGRWVNEQAGAVIVSPVVHTMPFADVEGHALDYWCHGLRLTQGDTVIDVGAGVGEETIVFSRLVGPGGKVVSIEAHPATFECLMETVRRSGLQNVSLVGVALGEADGVVHIRQGQNYLANSIVASRQQSGGADIPMKTLDTLSAELGLGEIALIKMNIEGAEVAALRGMTKVLAKTRNVVISCHDFLADRNGDESLRTRAVVEEILRASGFAMTRRTDHPDKWARDYVYGTRSTNG